VSKKGLNLAKLDDRPALYRDNGSLSITPSPPFATISSKYSFKCSFPTTYKHKHKTNLFHLYTLQYPLFLQTLAKLLFLSFLSKKQLFPKIFLNPQHKKNSLHKLYSQFPVRQIPKTLLSSISPPLQPCKALQPPGTAHTESYHLSIDCKPGLLPQLSI
jgi:hypothetical protein